jgi:hypothetical protein
MRSLASFFAHAEPDVAAIGGIDGGGALSIATRFALGWAYRDGQALFWNDAFAAARVLEGRGPLRVEGTYAGRALDVFGVRLARDRVRNLRLARSAVREAPGRVLLFAAGLWGRIRFEDLGLAEVGATSRSDACVAARAFDLALQDATDGKAFSSLVVRAAPAAEA